MALSLGSDGHIRSITASLSSSLIARTKSLPQRAIHNLCITVRVKTPGLQSDDGYFVFSSEPHRREPLETLIRGPADAGLRPRAQSLRDGPHRGGYAEGPSCRLGQFAGNGPSSHWPPGRPREGAARRLPYQDRIVRYCQDSLCVSCCLQARGRACPIPQPQLMGAIRNPLVKSRGLGSLRRSTTLVHENRPPFTSWFLQLDTRNAKSPRESVGRTSPRWASESNLTTVDRLGSTGLQRMTRSRC